MKIYMSGYANLCEDTCTHEVEMIKKKFTSAQNETTSGAKKKKKNPKKLHSNNLDDF